MKIQEVVNTWFTDLGITLGDMALTLEQKDMRKRLFYIWKDYFAKTIHKIKPTDLIKHLIDLVSKVKPVMRKLPKYTLKERNFVNKMLPKLEEARIITHIVLN